MNSPSPQPKRDDNQSSQAEISNDQNEDRFSTISTLVDQPDVLWYMAREGKLNEHESPEPGGEIVNSGVMLDYDDGNLTVELKVKLPVRDKFTPEEKHKRTLRDEIRALSQKEISCSWRERKIILSHGDNESEFSWPKPGGDIYDSMLKYTCQIKNENEFRDCLETSLKLFRLYIGSALLWSKRKVPVTLIAVRPSQEAVSEFETLSSFSQSSNIVLADLTTEPKPLHSKTETIGGDLLLSKPDFSLLDIPDMPDAVNKLIEYIPLLTHSTDSNTTVNERHKRRILIVEGNTHKRSCNLIEGLAGSISARVVYVSETLTTDDKVQELQALRKEYMRFYQRSLERTESRRTLLVLTLPDEDFKFVDPLMAQTSADELYQAFDGKGVWKNTIMVFLAESASDLKQCIQDHALLKLNSNGGSLDFSDLIRSTLAKIAQISKDSDEEYQVEAMDFHELSNDFIEDGCNTYSSIVDALERSPRVARARTLREGSNREQQTIIITRHDILSAWDLNRLEIKLRKIN